MSGIKATVVAVRLTKAEEERLDALRGPLSRSAYLHLVLKTDAKPVLDPS